MDTFCARLLVGLEGNSPDPLMLRYASMVARLNGHCTTSVSSASMTSSRSTSSGSVFSDHEVDDPLTYSGDAEVRFACLTASRGDESQSRTGAVRRQLRDRVQTYFTGFPEHVPVGWDILKGNAVERLKELAADFESDLLLVNRSPQSMWMNTRLAMEAPCPVWLVPGDWAPVLHHCLVPVDFSAESADCFRAAIDLARRSGGMRCVALHVYPTPTIRGDTSLGGGLLRQLRKASEVFLGGMDCRGVRVDALIEEGPSVAAVVNRVAVEQAVDLVVMTTRRRSRFAGLLRPSQTAQAIRSCPASFLVLKSSPRPMSLTRAMWEKLTAPDDVQFG